MAFRLVGGVFQGANAADFSDAVTLFTVTKGYYDDVPVEKALGFESALRAYLKSKYAPLMDNIEKVKDLSADDEKALTAAIEDFKKNGAY